LFVIAYWNDEKFPESSPELDALLEQELKDFHWID
jgi:hypothetical protein